MKYDKLFNSAETAEKEFSLAAGHISTTVIWCEQEKLILQVEASGKVDLLDENGAVLATKTAEKQTGGREVYEKVVIVKNENLVLRFPVVEWIDNYPHCDGEHDRWDSKIIGWDTVAFDLI